MRSAKPSRPVHFRAFVVFSRRHAMKKRHILPHRVLRLRGRISHHGIRTVGHERMHPQSMDCAMVAGGRRAAGCPAASISRSLRLTRRASGSSPRRIRCGWPRRAIRGVATSRWPVSRSRPGSKRSRRRRVRSRRRLPARRESLRHAAGHDPAATGAARHSRQDHGEPHAARLRRWEAKWSWWAGCAATTVT